MYIRFYCFITWINVWVSLPEIFLLNPSPLPHLLKKPESPPGTTLHWIYISYVLLECYYCNINSTHPENGINYSKDSSLNKRYMEKIGCYSTIRLTITENAKINNMITHLTLSSKVILNVNSVEFTNSNPHTARNNSSVDTVISSLL